MSTRNYQPPWRRAISYAFLALLALIFIGPFVITIATSFKTEPDATANPTLLDTAPAHAVGVAADLRHRLDRFGDRFPALVHEQRVRGHGHHPRDGSSSTAWPATALARLGFRGRKLVFGLVVATLAVPGVVLLIPRFLVLKELGLFNSYPGMILPMIVDATGIFLMRQFFLQVPVSLEEAGKVDGASIGRIWWSIVLPVVRPGLITLTILSFQGSWNEFQFFEIATISPKYYTLTTGLANIVGGGLSAGTQFPLKLGASALTILPIAILFFVLQRYITPGRISGAVKG